MTPGRGIEQYIGFDVSAEIDDNFDPSPKGCGQVRVPPATARGADRKLASNSKQHPELHQPNQDEKAYRQRSEQIYWDLGDVPRVVGSQFRLGIVLVDCLDFLEN
ncbi:hypothetical protein [Mesorhizobium sp. M0674]|uniref:hypothetical protein n=1 Tax=unclassified Mesorhizobium TaxID=325217 RepID=UPI00333A8421